MKYLFILITLSALLGCQQPTSYNPQVWQHVVLDSETTPSGGDWDNWLWDAFFETGHSYEVYVITAAGWTKLDSAIDPVTGKICYQFTFSNGYMYFLSAVETAGMELAVCKFDL